MVLKKSNSILNTGASQNVSNMCATLKRYLPFNYPGPGTLSVSVHGLDSSSDQDMSDFREVLEDIYDFLECSGPDLSLFFDSDGLPGNWHLFNAYSYTKYLKKDWVPLPQKARKIMSATFLESMPQSLEIEIIIKQCLRCIETNKTVFKWKSSDKTEECLNKKKEEERRRKRNLSHHSRGIQRLKRVKHDKKSYENQVSERNDALKKVTINIQDLYAIDARLVQKRHSERRDRKIKEKSKFKRKHFVCGRYSAFKGYTVESLKRDEMDALEEEENEDIFNYDEFESCEDFQENVKEKDSSVAWNDTEFSSFPENEKSLSDFIIPLKYKHTKSSKFDMNQSSKTKVNSASSEEIFRYPKGSCVFIESVRKHDSISVEDVDSGFASCLNTPERSIIFEKEDHHVPVIGMANEEKHQIGMESKIAEFMSQYVPVQMVLPIKMLDRLLNTLVMSDIKQHQVSDCQISFGNSRPPTFVVKVDSEKRTLYDNNWFVVCRATELTFEQNFTWQVQIGNDITGDPDHIVNVKHRFFESLKANEELSLQNVVNFFQECIKLDTVAQNKVNAFKDSMSKPKLSSSQHRASPWLNLKHFMNDHAVTMSVKEALKGSSSNYSSSAQTSELETTTENPKCVSDCIDKVSRTVDKNSSDNTVCDICFLPFDFYLTLVLCGHVYCLNCWNSHAFFGLYGSDAICCMSFECKQELNEALLRSLAPGHMVNKWLQRVQDKKIEGNSMCQWCPNARCDRVAVVNENSAKIVLFGSLVLCDCHVPWCFSCQTEPHWPASCGQMAAFRKLLAQTGNNLEIPSAKVNYTVELKRCPKCRYPIEKNQGCPSIVCRMCWFNFCWNCLRAVDHVVYTCKQRNDNFVTFNLQNQLVHNLPLNFFPDYLEMNQKRLEMKGRNVSSWLKEIRRHNMRLLKAPTSIPHHVENNEGAKEKTHIIAESYVSFLLEVYTFLESYYVLLCFVNMNREKRKKAISYTVNECAFLAGNLRFITWRLEEYILYKNLKVILRYANTSHTHKLLECGRKVLTKLKRNLHVLQSWTKHIDPSSISDIDPMKYLRYK